MKTSPVTEQPILERRRQVRTYRLLTLAVVSLAIFLDALDVSIVTIALPTLQRDLQLTTTDLQGVPGISVLAYAGFQLLGDVLLTCLVAVASFCWEPRSLVWPPSPWIS